jgi:hypothetical protein
MTHRRFPPPWTVKMNVNASNPALMLAFGALLTTSAALANPKDIDTCLDASDKMKAEGNLRDDEKVTAHEACLRALSDSSNVVMKYHLQEADFDITGRADSK